MNLKFVVLVASQVVAITAMERRANVFTAERVYNTIIDQSPYLVQATSTVTWTESASIVDTSLPTTIPTPTINY